MSTSTVPTAAHERADRPTGPAAAPAGPNRDNNFNLLRFGLASLVILSHSPEVVDGDRRRELLSRAFGRLSFGEVAVDGFFLLSGFLILQSWQRKPDLGDFLKKRILRIYPGFLVAALISVAVVGPLGAASPARYFAELSWRRLCWDGLLLRPPMTPPVFQGQPYPMVNGAMWTIEYEFRCYLLVALLGLCGVARRRWLWLALTAVALACVVGPVPLGWVGSVRGLRKIVVDPQSTARFVAYFAAGGCFYLFRDEIRYKPAWALGAAALLVACLFRMRTAEAGLATLGGYLLFWFAFARIPLAARFRSLPDISYGVYLYGWPTQKLFFWYFPGISPWLLFSASLGVCCVCGWLSWTLVEHPFLRLKRARLGRAPVPRASPA